MIQQRLGIVWCRHSDLNFLQMTESKSLLLLQVLAGLTEKIRIVDESA